MKGPAIVARIVLVRPRNPLNIGAAARAMANFGFGDLVVVEPHAPVWRETRSAVGAEAVIRAARAVDNLLEAIGDCSTVVGTTSGSRRTLERELVPLPELSRWLTRRARDPRSGRGRIGNLRESAAEMSSRGGPRLRDHGESRRGPLTSRAQVALLFGSEKTGLSNEHLSYCHALVRIPTVPGCPSMNLGQAVAVCCYELAPIISGKARGRVPTPASLRVFRSAPAPMHSLEHILLRAARLLDIAGYLKPKSRAATLLKLRRLLLGLELSNNDVKILGGVLAQLEWKISQ
jgi:tRNA C32,U32 (ribose-2'-O)-methylase TrmJ